MTSAAATAASCQRHGSGRSSGPKIRRSAAVHQSKLIRFAASKTACLCWRCRSTGSGDTMPNSGGVASALPAMESLGSAAPGWPKMALVERGPCRASRTKLSVLRLHRHQVSAVTGCWPGVRWRCRELGRESTQRRYEDDDSKKGRARTCGAALSERAAWPTLSTLPDPHGSMPVFFHASSL
jgi:hypothetical protein